MTGVTFNRFTNKWIASIRRNNVIRNLGSFENKKDAILARKNAEHELQSEVKELFNEQ